MDTGDALAVTPVSLLRSFASVKRIVGGEKPMTTENMEAYSLEVGDQITIQGAVYRITDIEDGDNLDYRFVLVDEEGYRRSVEAEGTNQFALLTEL
jgi:hypothetical protein